MSNMNWLITLITYLLILAYVGFSGYYIWNRGTPRGCICTTAACVCVGIVIVPIARYLAVLIYQALLVALVIGFLMALVASFCS